MKVWPLLFIAVAIVFFPLPSLAERESTTSHEFCEESKAPDAIRSPKTTILVYDHYTYHQHALTACINLGLPYQQASESDFVALMQSQTWDLVIMDFPSVQPYGDWQTEVMDHLDNGGKFIISYWNLIYTSQDFKEALQISIHGQETGYPHIHPWEATDRIWRFPNDLSMGITGDGHTHYGVKGEYLGTLGMTESLGGFTPSYSPTEAAVVRGKGGRVIVIGYLLDLLSNDDSGNVKADGVDLAENAIHRVLYPEVICDMVTVYSAGTLSLDFTLATPEPATWVTFLFIPQPSMEIIPLWSVPIPQLYPPVSLPISFSLPPIHPGWLGVWTGLFTLVDLEDADLDWIYFPR